MRAEGPIYNPANGTIARDHSGARGLQHEGPCGCLDEAVRAELFLYLATIVRNAGCECYRVGGVADHVHLAIRLSRMANVAGLVEELKSSSSRWLKTKSPKLNHFAWQTGYGAFSVGPSDLQALLQYIEGQEAHHAKHNFQDELRAFLKKYGVEGDERYLWD